MKQSSVVGRRSLAKKKPAKRISQRKGTASAVPKGSSHRKGALAPGTDPKRVAEILKRLDATYPGATCALTHSNAWELLVATILSAQCTDERVNKTTPELFRKYPTPEALAKVEPEQIEADIRSTGFFRNK